METEKNFIECLVSIMLHSEDNLTAEKNVYDAINSYATELLSKAFEKLDRSLVTKMSSKGYEIARKDSRRIQFMYGDVEFERRLWKKGKNYSYALDEYLGFKPYVRYSPLTISNMVQLSSKSTYRICEQAVNILTPLNVSHTAIHNFTKMVGKNIESYKKYEDEYNLAEKRVVDTLYLEGDAVFIKHQNGKIMNLHRFQVHEGVVKVSNKSICLNSQYFSSFSRKEAYEQAFTYLRNKYYLDKTTVISNSDGGSGYEPEVFKELALGCKRHEHFLDGYHRNKKIYDRTYFCPELIRPIQKAISEHSKDSLKAVMDTMDSIASIKDEEAIENTKRLRAYIKRNWEYMKPFRLRNLGSISRHGLGVCESNHRPYTYRMKKQGRTWKEKGATAVVNVIDAIKNGYYQKAVNSNWKKEREKIGRKDLPLNFLPRLLSDRDSDHKGVRNGRIVPKYDQLGRRNMW